MTWEDHLEKSGVPLILRRESLVASADTRLQRAGGQAMRAVEPWAEENIGIKKRKTRVERGNGGKN